MAEAHRRSWEMLASPGDWWTGAERISIAAETRRASALVDGLPDPGAGPAPLPEAAVFAVHKLIADLTNVNKEWYEEVTTADGMSDAHYIELLGVVVHVCSVDEFHRALLLSTGTVAGADHWRAHLDPTVGREAARKLASDNPARGPRRM